MIGGRIRNREAIIELEVTGPGQPSHQIEAVIDTGYNGYLTLPARLLTVLQLRFAGCHCRLVRQCDRGLSHLIGFDVVSCDDFGLAGFGGVTNRCNQPLRWHCWASQQWHPALGKFEMMNSGQ